MPFTVSHHGGGGGPLAVIANLFRPNSVEQCPLSSGNMKSNWKSAKTKSEKAVYMGNSVWIKLLPRQVLINQSAFKFKVCLLLTNKGGIFRQHKLLNFLFMRTLVLKHQQKSHSWKMAFDPALTKSLQLPSSDVDAGRLMQALIIRITFFSFYAV